MIIFSLLVVKGFPYSFIKSVFGVGGASVYTLWWQWNNRDKNSPYVFTNPKTGTRYTYRRMFLSGLCKTAKVKPFGFKVFRKYGPSILND